MEIEQRKGRFFAFFLPRVAQTLLKEQCPPSRVFGMMLRENGKRDFPTRRRELHAKNEGKWQKPANEGFPVFVEGIVDAIP